MDLSRYAEKLAAFPAGTETGRPTNSKKVEPSGAFLRLSETGPASSKLNKMSYEMQDEPEDAHLTGGTRSLSRRLLALNIPAIGVPQLKAVRGTAGRKQRIWSTVTES